MVTTSVHTLWARFTPTGRAPHAHNSTTTTTSPWFRKWSRTWATRLYVIYNPVFLYTQFPALSVTDSGFLRQCIHLSLNGWWWKGIWSQLAQTGHIICPKAVWNYNSVGTSKTPTIRSWGCWIESGRVSLTQLKRLRIPLIGICNLATGVEMQIKSSKSTWCQFPDIMSSYRSFPTWSRYWTYKWCLCFEHIRYVCLLWALPTPRLIDMAIGLAGWRTHRLWALLDEEECWWQICEINYLCALGSWDI